MREDQKYRWSIKRNSRHGGLRRKSFKLKIAVKMFRKSWR